jgi:hypothetical protein
MSLLRKVRATVAAGSAAAVLLLGSTAAFADATPIELVLTYTPSVSNTGTSAASGIAELVMLEGEVRISAAGLPHLGEEAVYVAWLVNSRTNEFFRLGSFNTDESTGTARFENVLPDAIPTKDWNLLLITAEHSGDAKRPSDKHSIAGVFPGKNQSQAPAVLPNTGGLDVDDLPSPNRPDWTLIAGLATLSGILGFGAGYGLRSRVETP